MASEAVRLSGLVVAQDEEARIRGCLASLAFCDECVVIDGGSADRTPQIAAESGARVIERPFTTMNDQKDFGRRACRGEWVMNVDADEIVSESLAREVKAVIDEEWSPAEGSAQPVAYKIPFRNFFRGEQVTTCGYFPDRHVRLLRKDAAFWDASVPTHDRVVVDGRIGGLTGHIDHYSFRSLDHFLNKSRRYAAETAAARHAEGRRVSSATIIGRTAFRFVRAYIFQRGFLQGRLGLVIAGLQAQEVFQKYARQWELERFGVDP